jgi:hypothetical protein
MSAFYPSELAQDEKGHSRGRIDPQTPATRSAARSVLGFTDGGASKKGKQPAFPLLSFDRRAGLDVAL